MAKVVVQELNANEELLMLCDERTRMTYDADRRFPVLSNSDAQVITGNWFLANKTNSFLTNIARHCPLWISNRRKVIVQLLEGQQRASFSSCPSSAIPGTGRSEAGTYRVVQCRQHRRPFMTKNNDFAGLWRIVVWGLFLKPSPP